MIKSAAASVSGSLVLGKGAQAAPAGDAPVSNGFAAVLNSTAATGQEGAADPAVTADPATTKQVRQANGKVAGKKLPIDLQDVAAKPAAASTDSTKPADGSAEDTTTTDDAAPALPAITAPIVLPGLIVPVSLQLPQTSVPATVAETAAAPAKAAPAAISRSTTDSLAQAAAAQASRPALPGTAEAGRSAKNDKAGTAAQPATVSAAQIAASLALPQTTAADLPGAMASAAPAQADGTVAIPGPSGNPALAAAILAASPKRADPVDVTIAPAEKPAAAQAAATPAITAIVTNAPTQALPDQVRVTVAPAEQPALAATATPISPPISTSAQLVSAQVAGSVVEPVTNRATVAAKSVEQPVAAPAAPAQAAANAAQPGIATAPRRETATPATDVPAARGKATAAADAPAAPALAPPSAPAQPLFAMQDGQSMSQATAPVTSAPATNAVAQTGHDFATLVDRLVEARDAASPNSVHAAITHSEFGQVSLRFDQDANGLSVAMSSADPEFARAVQASSAQSQMSGDNNDRNHDKGAQRQDTPGQQQTASSFSGQSQSQAQAQAQSSTPGRGDRNSQTQNDSRTGRASGQTQDPEVADTRGGIYA